MHRLREIRARLGVSQQVLANELGCSQGNITHYEQGQTLLPAMASKLIAVAASRGLPIGFDHVYGDAPLPGDVDEAAQSCRAPA